MNIISTAPHFAYSERDLLSFLLSQAVIEHQPAAVWRLPGSSRTQVLISNKYIELDREQFVEELDAGFLFAPFDRSENRIFLKADHLFTFDNGRLAPEPSDDGNTSEWLAKRIKSYAAQKYNPPAAASFSTMGEEAESFFALVTRSIREIEKGTFEKVVPSRTRTVNLSANFDVIEAFQRLSNAYPEALISYVSIPGIGNWLGATPELLVSVQGKSVFKTIALAGTLPYHHGIDVRSVAWTQKEIEEQALVERYVISCFKRVRLREYDEQGPKTVIAGNLMHLKSEFTVDMKATNFPQIGTVMLDLLHPTSAVCGMPLEPAMQFLKQHEAYDRSFYAGYLGPVNIHNDIELFVNIRCMQISGHQGLLYAGAGVTIDSIPEKEWAETEMKFQTLLNIVK